MASLPMDPTNAPPAPTPEVPARHARSAPRARRALTALAAVVLALGAWGVSVPTSSAVTGFTFAGSGWGHGVGMSQWGARGLAEQGSSAAQILGHYYSGTTVTTTSTATIRVLLATSSTLTLTPWGPTTFVAGAALGTTSAPVTVTSSGSTIQLSGGLNTSATGTVSIALGGPPLEVSPPRVKYNRGFLQLHPTGSGTVQAVVTLPMQDYLYGLGEMPSSWPDAALQAQAIAGRTFAQKKVAKAAGAGTYDIVGGLPDQSYLGWDKEYGSLGQRWVAAVDATASQVVTYGGGLIDAVYSASSGGHTENSETVWVAAVPYLRGVPDPADLTGGNPNAMWSRTYNGAQLGAWFGVGEVTSIQVLGPVGVSGRLDKATIRLIGTAGSRDLIGSSFRSIVNTNSPSLQLMSSRFTVSGATPGPSVPSVPSNSPPSGIFTMAKAEGSTVVVGGAAGDPDGAPRLRVVSTMGRETAVREVQAHPAGLWMAQWTGGKGTRTVCVWVLDNPTGASTALGCRDITVK